MQQIKKTAEGKALVLIMLAFLAGCTTDTASREKLSEGIVKTAYGSLQGENRGGVVRFLGIPYAQSIAGRNRFAPPQPVEPWTGVREALHYADSSPQPAKDPQAGTTAVSTAFIEPPEVKNGDNCLALNIWTPEGADGTLPVMVWLHGGGWTSGSGSCAVYDGENLARRGDVIAVTINHRLGPSGFTDLSRIIGGDFAGSSNLAVKDMIAALEWVHSNIASFGGDPEKVMIFGESGGGWKVSTLLGTPSAKGLFQRAVIQSGPLTRFMTQEEADELAGLVLEELGVTPETAEKLYNISGEELQKAGEQALSKLPARSGIRTPGFPSGFWPVIDGDLITSHVWDPVAAPGSLDVPLLVGQNGTEMSLFMTADTEAYSLDKAGLEKRTEKLFGPDMSPLVLEIYYRDYPDYNPSALWFRIYSDLVMGTLHSEILDVRSSAENSAPVYAYRFDWQTPIQGGKLYSPHTIEIPFVFNNVSTAAGIEMTEGGPEAEALAETVSDVWVEFARTGKPAADGLPEWPEYTAEGRESMHLDTVSSLGPFMDPAMVKLFHKIVWAMNGLSN